MLIEALLVLSEIVALVSYISGSSLPKALTRDEEKELVARMDTGDPKARDLLVEHNMRLSAHIAKKYAGNGRDMDDLISIGAVGLIKAVNTFDSSKGRALGTYAARCIENEILMAVRAERKTRGETPINDAVGTDKDGNSVMLIDVLSAPGENVEEKVELSLDIVKLKDAILYSLNKRERVIIELRYGLLTGECKTQKEIAKSLGISRSYVSERGYCKFIFLRVERTSFKGYYLAAE